jgi:hypothetical protein
MCPWKLPQIWRAADTLARPACTLQSKGTRRISNGIEPFYDRELPVS